MAVFNVGDVVRENWSSITGEVADVVGDAVCVKWPSGRPKWVIAQHLLHAPRKIEPSP